MIKKLVLLMMTFVVVSMSSTVLAAESSLKIGVIDLQKVMQKSSQVAAINSQLEKRFKPKQQTILASRKVLQDKVEKFTRNSAVMSASDRTKLQNDIIADRAKLQTAEMSYQQEINNIQGQETQKFMIKLKNIITQVAQNGGYTLIMIKQSIPYVNDKLDVTDAVLSLLERR